MKITTVTGTFGLQSFNLVDYLKTNKTPCIFTKIIMNFFCVWFYNTHVKYTKKKKNYESF